MATAGTVGQPPWATIPLYVSIAALVGAMFCVASVGVLSAGLRIMATSGSPLGSSEA